MLIKEANSYEESVNYISNSTKVFFFSPLAAVACVYPLTPRTEAQEGGREREEGETCVLYVEKFIVFCVVGGKLM